MKVRVGHDGKVVWIRVENQPVDDEYAAAATKALFGYLFEPGRDAAGQGLTCDIIYRYRWDVSRPL